MGDIVSLVEDVKKSVDQASAQKFAKRMQSGERFDLNDFKDQIMQMRKACSTNCRRSLLKPPVR